MPLGWGLGPSASGPPADSLQPTWGPSTVAIALTPARRAGALFISHHIWLSFASSVLGSHHTSSTVCHLT